MSFHKLQGKHPTICEKTQNNLPPPLKPKSLVPGKKVYKSNPSYPT